MTASPNGGVRRPGPVPWVLAVVLAGCAPPDGPSPASLAVEPGSLVFGVGTDEAALLLRNDGDEALAFEVTVAATTDGVAWLSVDPAAGTLDGGGERSLTVRVQRRDELDADAVHRGELRVEGQGLKSQVVLVELHVGQPLLTVEPEGRLDYEQRKSFVIRNSGEGRLRYEVTLPGEWVTAEQPLSGTIRASEPRTFPLFVDKTAVAWYGSGSAEITIGSNGLDRDPHRSTATLHLDVFVDPSCRVDAGCTRSGYYCDRTDAEQGVCQQKRAAGDDCDRPAQCASGHCADRVCCEVACDEPCRTCASEAAPGTCVPLDDRSACDGGRCVVDGTCQAGSCQGAAPDCGDGLACTDDRCDPEQGCVREPRAGFCLLGGACVLVGEPCDDGLACTAETTCQLEGCLGRATTCTSDDACQAPVCREPSGCDTVPVDDGAPCEAPHTAPGRCQEGRCERGACDEGFADCNEQPGDGCEVELASDAAHCGACRRRCETPRAVVGCRQRSCVFERCEPGYEDANHDCEDGDCEGDGCETPLFGCTVGEAVSVGPATAASSPLVWAGDAFALAYLLEESDAGSHEHVVRLSCFPRAGPAAPVAGRELERFVGHSNTLEPPVLAAGGASLGASWRLELDEDRQDVRVGVLPAPAAEGRCDGEVNSQTVPAADGGAGRRWDQTDQYALTFADGQFLVAWRSDFTYVWETWFSTLEAPPGDVRDYGAGNDTRLAYDRTRERVRMTWSGWSDATSTSDLFLTSFVRWPGDEEIVLAGGAGHQGALDLAVCQPGEVVAAWGHGDGAPVPMLGRFSDDGTPLTGPLALPDGRGWGEVSLACAPTLGGFGVAWEADGSRVLVALYPQAEDDERFRVAVEAASAPRLAWAGDGFGLVWTVEDVGMLFAPVTCLEEPPE